MLRSPHPRPIELPDKKVLLLILILGTPIILAGPEAYNYFDWNVALILNIFYCFSISILIGVFCFQTLQKIFTSFDHKLAKSLFKVSVDNIPDLLRIILSLSIFGISSVAIINQMLWARVQISDFIEPHQTKIISSWTRRYTRESYFPSRSNDVINYIDEYSTTGIKTNSYSIGVSLYVNLIAETGGYDSICEDTVCEYPIIIEYLPNTKRIINYNQISGVIDNRNS